MDNIELFSRRIGVDKHTLKDALTHHSFYEDKDEKNGNSRMVFTGMFIFKGQVAEILGTYFSGTGTQLQHILGNLFKNEYLNTLFDEWKLRKWVRTSETFNIKTHKHIFVYAVFGCISKIDDDKRRHFIFKYFLNEKNKHIFIHVKRNKDLVYQAKELAKITLGEKIKIEMQITEGLLHKATITFNNGIVIAEAISKSYRYARKKAMKSTLEIISAINFEKYISESNYIERIQKRIEEEKLRKQTELQKKLQEKEKQRLLKVETNKRIKKARDLARRQTQADAKKRKEERAKIQTTKEAKEQRPLSANKRRHLEDKRK